MPQSSQGVESSGQPATERTSMPDKESEKCLMRELKTSLSRAQAKDKELMKCVLEQGRRLEEALGEQRCTLLGHQKMLAEQHHLLVSVDKRLACISVNPFLEPPPRPYVAVEPEFGAPETTGLEVGKINEEEGEEDMSQSSADHKREIMRRVVGSTVEQEYLSSAANAHKSIFTKIVGNAGEDQGRAWTVNSVITSSAVTPTQNLGQNDDLRVRCARFVMGQTFNLIAGALIIANAIFIFLQTDHAARHIGEELPPIYPTAETFFFACFFWEVVLRIWVFRGSFFCGPEWRWNLVDLLIISTAAFEEIMKLMQDGGRITAITGLRVLRSVKVTRIVRMIQQLRVFRDLRIMLASIISTFFTLGWAILCLLMIKLGFSVFFLTVTTEYQALHGQVLEFEPFFSSMPVMVFRLFQLTTGGFDWKELADLLSFSTLAVVVLCMYIAFMNYAILNILVGICCDTASRTADDDFEISLLAEQDREDNATGKLKTFFHDIDTDGSGKITWKEVDSHLNDSFVHSTFRKLDLERSHLKTFFDLLKNKEEKEPSISIDEFIRGCTRLRYNVKNIDLIAANHAQQESSRRQFKELSKKIDSLHRATDAIAGLKRH